MNLWTAPNHFDFDSSYNLLKFRRKLELIYINVVRANLALCTEIYD